MPSRFRGAAELSEDHFVDLLLGHHWFPDGGFQNDWRAMRAAWSVYRSELLALWREDPKPPWASVRGRGWHREIAWIQGRPDTFPWAWHNFG